MTGFLSLIRFNSGQVSIYFHALKLKGGVGSWSALHEREFLIFMELPYSMKGDFWFLWSDPTPWKVISEFRGVHSMKGDFQFLWSYHTPQKGILDFRGVTLLHDREFLIKFHGVTPLHER